MKHKLGNYGKYELNVIKYPSGRWGFAGSVPLVLYVDNPHKPGMTCPTFETKEAAIHYFETKKHLIIN